MTAAAIAQQVGQFLEYHRKTGLEWDLAFVSWATSKAFSPDDYYAVRGVVQLELVARGVLTFTDMPELADEDLDDAGEDSAWNEAA
jgi:hypothetical protein